MDLADIQHEIERLPQDEQWTLLAWLDDREQRQWDAEIERDFSPGGRGNKLLEEMKTDAQEGHFHPFEEGQSQKRQ